MTRHRILHVASAVAMLAAAGLAGCDSGAQAPEITPTKAVSQLALPTGEGSLFLTDKHFVTKWLVLGPFQFEAGDFGGEQQQAATDKEFVPNEAALDGTQPAPKGTTWQEKDFQGDERPGRVNLDALYSGIEHAAAYAVCWLHCPKDVPDAKILAGSDDYLKIWVNGKLVHTYKAQRRPGEPDQDEASGVALRQGYNRVVVKCVDVVLDWDFYFRLTNKDGRPVTAAAPSLMTP
jgi:hypothetical protein